MKLKIPELRMNDNEVRMKLPEYQRQLLGVRTSENGKIIEITEAGKNETEAVF